MYIHALCTSEFWIVLCCIVVVQMTVLAGYTCTGYTYMYTLLEQTLHIKKVIRYLLFYMFISWLLCLYYIASVLSFHYSMLKAAKESLQHQYGSKF